MRERGVVGERGKEENNKTQDKKGRERRWELRAKYSTDGRRKKGKKRNS